MTDNTIWIRTAPDIEGVYRVVLEFGADDTIGLDADAALLYAHQMLRAVAVAEYEAAVLAQLEHIVPDGELANDTAVMVVGDMRKDRPPLSWCTPLSLVPGVSSTTRKGFLLCKLHDVAVGQWEIADAKEHALFVMEAVHCAELDSAYMRQLRSMDIPEETARATIGKLADFR